MIESLCLAVLFVVVALRARRSYRKAAWWGTVFGMVSVMTYGVVGAGPTDLDRVLGDRNSLTLVRDLTALAAMWAFHNAVARERGRLTRRLPWWSLLAAALSVAVPFSLIHSPGETSRAFVLDRLDQTPVWLFASLYTAYMGTVAGLIIRTLSEKRTALSVMWAAGFGLMVVSDVLELTYLAIAHFTPVSVAFKVHYYYVAELPFFSGVLFIGAGFMWLLAARAFWWSAARWAVRVDARGQGPEFTELRLALAKSRGWSDRQLAFDSAANIRDRVKLNPDTLSGPDRHVFAAVERALSKKIELVPS
ncbi:hypothetical protein [Clavibacter michiganensis]|uniref:Hypothetical membrane protein n=1 Tax=Clavibacter michiganensis subsp. michiganensis (strain NCPPB 382) TaxID=443906 RepID=A5CLP0_CLAM3|nr:hypothetical protein [Clavibacter michiganensis]UDM22096.1 hypothetical protein LHJ47_15785 [Clavibacter michiganensis subsp. michiganensis]CAM98510.1 hypothetical membrane protein [Clavibacter michiganensis subsp. michiganensis NCPPB 382]